MGMRSQAHPGWVCAVVCLALSAFGCDDGDSPAAADGGGGMAVDAAGGAGGMGGTGGTGGMGGMMMTGVGVSDPAARACEVLFTASPADAISIAFGAEITGTWRRREDRVAVGFFHRADGPIPEGALSVAGVEQTPEMVRCYDRLGAPLSGVELVLE